MNDVGVGCSRRGRTSQLKVAKAFIGIAETLAKATTGWAAVRVVVVKLVSIPLGIDFHFADAPSANDDISSKQLIVLTIKDYDVRRSDFRFGRDYDLLLALDGHIGDVRVTDNNVADRPRQF